MKVIRFIKFWEAYANFSHDAEQLEVKVQQLVDSRENSLVWRRQSSVRCQVGYDGVRVGDIKTVVVERRHLMQRIHQEELRRPVFAFIKVDIFQLKRLEAVSGNRQPTKKRIPWHPDWAALSPSEQPTYTENGERKIDVFTHYVLGVIQ